MPAVITVPSRTCSKAKQQRTVNGSVVEGGGGGGASMANNCQQ